MKKILTVLFLLCIVPCASAMNLHQAMMTVCKGGASCETACAPTDMETANVGNNCFNHTASDWRSTAFVSDGSTICAIDFYMDTSTGSAPSFTTIAVYIYSDDGTTDCGGAGCPNELVATFTSLSTSGMGAAGWTAKVTGSAALSNSTRYHVVLASNGVDNTNIVRWYSDSTCATENINYSGDGSAWTNTITHSCHTMRFYKQ